MATQNQSNQSASGGYYGAYGRKNAREAAKASGQSTYTTDGGSRTYNLKGELVSKAPASGNTASGNTITSGNLAPVVPTNLPNQTIPTYGGIAGATEQITNTANANAEADANNKDAGPSLTEQLLAATREQGTISSSVDRTAQDAAKKKSDLYTSQLEQEQLANRRAVEALQKNMAGMSTGSLNGEISRITRDSLSKQADIAILQTAANRDYETAASIADRQVEMKLEAGRANLEALKLLEGREYDDIKAKKEREFKKLEQTENAIKQLKLNVAQFAGSGAGSILSQLSAIDTSKPDAYDQAVKIAGKYASDPLDRQIKQAQLGKLQADAAESAGTGTGAAIVAGQKPTGKPDYTNAGYANRTAEANPTLTDIENRKYTLLWDTESRRPERLAKNKDLQLYKQAQENFLKAVLRKESGAAISPEEEATYAPVYFVMPLDSKEVVLQKQRARIDAMNSLIGSSGKAYSGSFLEKPTSYLNIKTNGTSQQIPTTEEDYSNYLLEAGQANSFNYFQ